MSSRGPYPSDLSDAEWGLLAPLLRPPTARGRPRKWAERLMDDAVFYVLGSGCARRMLPRGFPHGLRDRGQVLGRPRSPRGRRCPRGPGSRDSDIPQPCEGLRASS